MSICPQQEEKLVFWNRVIRYWHTLSVVKQISAMPPSSTEYDDSDWEDDDDGSTEDNVFNQLATPPNPTKSLEEIILQRYIPLAHPETNVIILDGEEIGVEHPEHIELLRLLSYLDWDHTDSTKPDCHLCGNEICEYFRSVFSHNGSIYTVIFKGETEMDDPTAGSLQCMYCLNYYHRAKCNISISENSYFNIMRSRQWTCPTCVPAFVTMNNNKCNMYEKLLLKLAKILNPQRDESIESTNIQAFNYICISFSNFFGIYDIG